MSDPQDTIEGHLPDDKTSRALQTCLTLFSILISHWQMHRMSKPCHHKKDRGSAYPGGQQG